MTTMTAAEEQEPQVDVWSWTSSNKPTLTEMRTLKHLILTDPAARRRLNKHLDELDENKHPRIAGLSRWLLAQYHRAWPLLQGESDNDPIVRFAKATCCLKGQVKETEDHVAARRPDLAASLASGHPDLLNDPAVYKILVDAHIFDHDLDGLKESLKKAPSVFKSEAQAAYGEGKVQELEGQYEEARDSYLKALEIDPEHRGALLALAFHHDLGGDDEEALEYYKRLASISPLDVHAVLNYGVLLEDHGHYKDAVKCYEGVLSAFPNHSRAVSYMKDAKASINMVFNDEIDRLNDKRNQMLRIPISDFELSVRARNCLSKMNIETLGDLVIRTESELLAYKNFGETSLSEIKVLLENRGLRLGMDLNEDPVPPDANHEQPPERPPVELPPGVDPAVLATILADMDLSVRCRKALALVRAMTVGDLLHHSEAELLALKNFGALSLKELKARLTEYGVALRPN